MSIKFKSLLISTLVLVVIYSAISAIAGLRFKQEFELLVTNNPTSKLKSYDFGLFESKAVIGIENKYLTEDDFLIRVKHGPIVLSPDFQFNTFLPDLDFATFIIRSDVDRALSQFKLLHRKLEVDHLISAIMKYSYSGEWQARVISNKTNVTNDYIKFDFEGMNILVKPDCSEICDTVITGKIGQLSLKDYTSDFSIGPIAIDSVNPDFSPENNHSSFKLYIEQFKNNKTDSWDVKSITFNSDAKQNQNGLLDSNLKLTVGDVYTRESGVTIANLTFDLAGQNFPRLTASAINALNENPNPIAGLHKMLTPVNPEISPEATLNQFSFSFGAKDYITSSAYIKYNRNGFRVPNTLQDLIKNWQANINLISTHDAPAKIARTLKKAWVYSFPQQYSVPYFHGKQAAKKTEEFIANSLASGLIVKTDDEYRSVMFYNQGVITANGKRLTEAEK
ncbi:DUF945 family protein [Catenovulum maritimum]|uniref:Uncharacterized protein n=1 Tax=Catenovulum maritimum TaxID=1513271 RepID=A0A0J8GY52_9ALTE|nr:DUF945 family protein [Catenovulum maritimum]KMT65658.1 hypothetical protein XM47_08155 [Catenovulum maritimum]